MASAVTSANPDDLDRYVTRASQARRALDDRWSDLAAQQNAVLSACGDYAVASSVLNRAAAMLSGFDQNERFVDKVSDELKRADRDPSTGVATISNAMLGHALRATGLADRPPPVTVEPGELLGNPPTSGFVDDPICAANGNFVHVDADLTFPGWSSVLDVVRVYNSLGASTNGAFGAGWSSLLDVGVTYVEGGGLRMRLADGAVVPFAEREGEWRTSAARGLSARATDHGWIVQRGHDVSWTFDREGGLISVSSPPAAVQVRRDGDRVVELTEARSGRSVRFEWAGGRVVAAQASDGRSVYYRYDDDGFLIDVDRPSGGTTFVVEAGLITSFADADGVVMATNVYDERGRVVAQTSDLGRTTTYAYSELGTTLVSDTIGGPRNAFTHDRSGNLTAMVDGAGRTMRIAYDDAGRTTSVTDRRGAVRRFAYDERGNLVARSDPDGLGAAWAWDELDRLTDETHRNGSVTSYAYQGEQRHPFRITGPMGEVYAVTMAPETELPLEVVDPDGVITTFEWDDDGQMTAVIDGLGNRTVFAFDGAGRLERTVDGSGLVTEFRSNDAGRVVEALVAGASSRHTYTAAGRPLSGVDAGGVSWSAVYSASGRAASFSDAAGSTVGFEWDPFGNLAAVVAPDGGRFEQFHDAMNRLVGSRDPAGHEMRRSYDAEGRVVEITDAAGRTWRRRLDALGRMARATEPDGAIAEFRYHPDGAVAEVRHPDGTKTSSEVDANGRVRVLVDRLGGRFTIDYTPAGRVLERRTPSGRVERFEYDAAGRAVAHRRGSVETRYELDGRGRVVRAEGPDGAARYRYVGGELVEVTGPAGAVVAERDAAGRITSVAGGEGERSAYAWDQRGLLSEAVDGAGVTSTFTRDIRGRMATSAFGRGAATSFGYDRTGFLDTVTDPGGTISRVLDPTGLPLGERRADGTTLSRTVDPMGRTLSVEVDGTAEADYRYDVMGQLIEAVRTNGDVRTSFEWDANGRLVAVEGPTGRLSAERDPDGVPVGYTDGTSSVILEHGTDGRLGALEARDASGRITGREDGSVYRYDDAGRLIEALDAAGVRSTFGYGDDGLLAEETGPLGDRRYSRGFRGRLERIEHDDGTETRITYDGAGRRVRAERTDGSWTKLTWDGLSRLLTVERRSADGEVERLDLDLDALGRPFRIGGSEVVWDDIRTGRPLRIGGDRFLQTTSTARHATAASWTSTTTDPWGAEAPGRDDGPHLGFHDELAAWGLVWLGARVYDTTTREFLTPDPLPPVAGRPGAASVYAYGFLDPVNYLDPSGMRPISQADFDKIREREEQGRFGQAWQAVTEDPWGTLLMVGVVAVGVGLVFATGGAVLIGAGILIGAGSQAVVGVLAGNFSPRATAVGGALGAIPGGNSYKMAIATGAGLGAGQEVVTQAMNGDDLDWGMIGLQAVIGGATGGLTHGVGTKIRGTQSPIQPTALPVAPNTAGRGADFVAGPIGSAPPVPVSQSRMAAGFDAAGFPRTPTASSGMEYVLPDGSLVRLMASSGSAPLRASFTNANGGPINPFTGKPVQPPAPSGWSMKDWVRALTHVEQTP